MRDVADAAGVHISTASRALDPGQRARISAATIARIESVARKLGYVPDLVAAGLARGRTQTVGVVVSDLLNPFTGPVVRGVASVCEDHGLIPLIAETNESAERLDTVLRHFVSRRVEAIITTAVHATDTALLHTVTRSGIPVVLAVRGMDGGRFPAVLHDDVTGGSLAAAHLLELGHKVIAAIAGPADVDTFVRREQGFSARLAQAGRGVKHAVVTAPNTSMEEGRRLMHLLMDGDGPVPTAVFAANDMMAIGAIEGLEERGLSCPDDVSVVGYDDMPLVVHMTPPLTTISLPAEELGRTAAQMALKFIQKPRSRPQTIQLPAALIVRGSTAPLRRKAVPAKRDRSVSRA
jgi:LacI family transcriptional regulator, galactose operon repressor